MVWLIFLAILSLLVFVHELGHFVMARRAGVRVDEFGLGFPPKLFGIKWGETVYSLNLFPLGGFVKIYGEDGDGEKSADHFASKSIWQRTKIISAGVIMNLILGVALLSIGYSLGLPTAVDSGGSGTKVQVTSVSNTSPAALAGIKIGDALMSIKVDGREIVISDVKQFQEQVANFKGKEMETDGLRGNEKIKFNLVPRVNPPVGEGPIGVGLANMAIVSYPWYEAVVRAMVTTINLAIAILLSIGGLIRDIFVQGKVSADLAGPVGIFVITGQFSKLGFVYLLQLMALLTVNLAVINILPFPALDGGRLFLLALEKIKGAPLNPGIEKLINSIGFAVLILLIVLVTVKDVAKLF